MRCASSRFRLLNRPARGRFAARSAVAWVVLATLLPLAIGFMPKSERLVRTADGLVAERFPCEDSPCGCASAARCWTRCCCNTPATRLAWCLREEVIPPAFAGLPSGWTAERVGLAIAADQVGPPAPTASGDDAELPPCCRPPATAVASVGPFESGACESGSCDSGSASDRACCEVTPPGTLADAADAARPAVPVGGTPGRCRGDATDGGIAVVVLVPFASTTPSFTPDRIVGRLFDRSEMPPASTAATLDPPPPRRA